MGLTPVEVRHVKVGRALLGYRRTETDELLDEIAASYEDVWRERADLADKVVELEDDLVRYKELEGLVSESHRVRALLRAALATIDAGEGEGREVEAA